MKELTAAQFDDFFYAIHGYRPFTWQSVLVERICRGEWPKYLKAPTASGKTSLVDIAVFALAAQAHLPSAERTAPRRIFFVVDRRIVVDETSDRGVKIAQKLRKCTSDQPVLQIVRDRLLHIAGISEGNPLDCVQLRGGIYRDNRWVQSPLQPTIIASTVDQVGSRLLFRGYGVSESARPIHAALVGNDSLIVLDEAHLSQPFSEALQEIVRYRSDQWSSHPIRTPFRFIEMTATPPAAETESVFSIDDREVVARSAKDPQRDDKLRKRRQCAKRIQLISTDRVKGKRQDDALAEKLAEVAQELSAGAPVAIGVVANTIRAARRVHSILNEKYPELAHLMIGRMRPIDRDDFSNKLRDLIGTGVDRTKVDQPLFVVATQCIEVGADLDFDFLVTECASLDSLRQRFGRLNRGGRDIDARGAIVIRADEARTESEIEKRDSEPSQQPFVYGNALSRTWNWLKEIADDNVVDFGSDAIATQCDKLSDGGAPLRGKLEHSPTLHAGYLDRMATTSPTPWPDPDPSLFLHGPKRNDPEVQVCWRADLPWDPWDNKELWIEIVSLLPPSSAECVSVPISLMKRWLRREPDLIDQGADIPGQSEPEETERSTEPVVPRPVLAWRGLKRSSVIYRPDEIRPGDTLVLPVREGGWSVLAHLPGAPPDPSLAYVDEAMLSSVDQAERAFNQARDKGVVRLHRALVGDWPEEGRPQLWKFLIGDEKLDCKPRALQDFIRELASSKISRLPAKWMDFLTSPRTKVEVSQYPGNAGVVVMSAGRRGLRQVYEDDDDGEDSLSKSNRKRRALKDHLLDVRSVLERFIEQVSLAEQASDLLRAAELHDLGKADTRFQALLINGEVHDVAWQPCLWAKSAELSMSKSERERARTRSGLPAGFRHELLSVALAEASGQIPEEPVSRDLVLHLIAAHHGYCRPFAPPAPDESPPSIDLRSIGIELVVDGEQRSPCDSLAAGHSNRFYRVLRRHGWWGLAYLETLLRLADQTASAESDRLPASRSVHEEVNA